MSDQGQIGTATDMVGKSHRRQHAARAFAMQITAMIRDYLAPRSLRDVEAFLAEQAYNNGFELTSLQMREEYEARGRLLLSMDEITTGQFCPQPKATPHG